MKDSVAVGVVGLGFGANHARVLQTLPHARLAAVCDGDSERLAAAVPDCDVPRYGDVDVMLAGEQLDALVVALPAYLHAPVGSKAIEAGCAVLIEKPMATTRAEGMSLALAAREAGVSVMPGHIERFNPALVELRRRVRAGEIGRVVQITARRMGAIRHPPRDVNVIYDSAIHDIDAMRWVLGSEVAEVYASARSALSMPVEDSVTAVLQFEGAESQPGAMASLEVSWVAARRVRDLAVVGETGMFVLRYASQSLEHYKTPPRSGPLQGWALAQAPEEGPAVQIPVEAREQLVLELEAFVEAVRRGSAMPVTVEDGLASLAVADALTLSARTGRPVQPGSVES